MDLSQFEALSRKVEHAISVIEDLKREKEALHGELGAVQEKSSGLERALAEREDEISTLKNELNSKAENINMAGEKIRDMVNRLESVLA